MAGHRRFAASEIRPFAIFSKLEVVLYFHSEGPYYLCIGVLESKVNMNTMEMWAGHMTTPCTRCTVMAVVRVQPLVWFFFWGGRVAPNYFVAPCWVFFFELCGCDIIFSDTGHLD